MYLTLESEALQKGGAVWKVNTPMESTLKTNKHGRPCLKVSHTGGINDAYRAIDLALQKTVSLNER